MGAVRLDKEKAVEADWKYGGMEREVKWGCGMDTEMTVEGGQNYGEIERKRRLRMVWIF